MSATGKLQEVAGYVEEEFGELLGNKKIEQDGREERNKGRVADGKSEMLTEPGTTNN